MKTRDLILLFWGILLGIALIALVSTRSAPRPTFQGSLIDPPAPAKDIHLNDQHGQPFHLSDQQGKVVLVFFGYTFCPDVCPTTLIAFQKIQEALGSRASQVAFVFVTVDPNRDTPEQLKTHLALFSPNFIGLTGEPADLEAVWADYFISPEIRPGANTAGYLVEHTTRVYVIDKQGNLRLTFPFGQTAEAMLADVQTLLDE
ncbi:MAG: SCO family protein [Anaerolineales bacterium]